MSKSFTGHTPPTPSASIYQFLQSIIEHQAGMIAAVVASDAFEESDSISYLSDVCQYGCISGLVSDLIYYTDTRAFFDKHYPEIEDIRIEYEEATGSTIAVQGDLKNFYAWFAYEATAARIYEEWKSQ